MMSTATFEPSARGVGTDPHQMVFGLQHLCIEALNEVIESALRRTDDFLFDRAQVGADGVELTALRDLRRVRGQIAQGFAQSAAAGFRAFSGMSAVEGGTEVVLRLVEEEDLQQQLADEQLIDNIARLHAQALAALDARMAALAARASLPGGDNPAGPKALAKAIREGMRGSDLTPNVAIALLKFYERELGEALHNVYARMNERLASAGILPSLEAPAPKPKPDAHKAAAAASEKAVDASDDASGMGGSDSAFFNSLVGLLQGWRQRLGGQEGGRAMAGGHGAPMPTSDVMSVLHRMQQQPPAGLAQAFDDELQVSAGFVHAQATTHVDQLTIAWRKVHQAGRTPEHGTADLARVVLDRKITMPAGCA